MIKFDIRWRTSAHGTQNLQLLTLKIFRSLVEDVINKTPSNFTAILSKILTSSFHFHFQVVNAYFRSILKLIIQFNPCLTLSLLHFNPPFPLKFQARVLRLEPHVFSKIPESLRPFTRSPKSSRTLGARLSRFAQDPLDLVSFSKTLIEE